MMPKVSAMYNGARQGVHNGAFHGGIMSSYVTFINLDLPMNFVAKWMTAYGWSEPACER
jgi:hypothetical protein